MKNKLLILLIVVLFLGGVYFVYKNYSPQILEDTNLPSESVVRADGLTAFYNSNEESNIPLVVLAPNNEAVVAFTKEVNGEIKVDKILFQTAFEQKGVIQLDENQKPQSMDFEHTKILFSNYTNETVDMVITRPDGSTETISGSRIIPQSDLSFLIPNANADMQEVLEVVSLAVNTVQCGIGLGSVIFSGGSTSLMVYMSCASLGSRMKNGSAEMDKCEKFSTECVFKEVGELIEKEGPVFLAKGIRLKGVMKNSVTGSPVTNGVLKAVSKKTSLQVRGEWNDDGTYEFYFRDGGAFDTQTASEGFADTSFITAISSSKVQLYVPEKNDIFQFNVDGRDYDEVEVDLYIDPQAFIRGEVIDAQEGDPIEDAELKLYQSGKVVDEYLSDEDGLFALQPALIEGGNELALQVSAKGFKDVNIPFTISYEVIENTDEYEIEGWDGMVRLEPGSDLILKIHPAQQKTGKCADWHFDYDIALTINDGKVTGEIVCPEDASSCFQLETEGEIDQNGNFKGYHDLPFVGSVVFEGGLSENGGQGTWCEGGWLTDGMPTCKKEWAGKSHKDEICTGTWSAG